MKRTIWGAVMVCGVLAGGAALMTACEKADDAIDCNEICDRYKQCLGGNDYDESACRARCRDKADDQDFNRRVDECAACVSDDKSCVQNAFSCTAECIGVVP